MKKIIIIFSIILVFIIIDKNQVQAIGNVTLSSNKNNVYVGDEFSISVNLSGASVVTLTTRITIDTNKVEYVSGPSNSNFSNGKVIYTWTDPNGGTSPISSGTIATFKFRAKATGNANFSITGDFYDAEENQIIPTFSGKSVTIKEVTTENTTPSTPSQGTTGNTSSGGGTTSGNTGTSNGSGTSTGTSQNTNNTTLSSNSYLKSLQLSVEGISPKFSKNTTQYYITVPNSVQSINVTATPEDKNAKVSISGNTGLQAGLNKISILVTAQNGKNKRTYTINVTKTDDPNKSNANLENLAIENCTFVPEFSPDVTNYTVELQQDITSANILAVPQNEKAQVSVIGNENLQIGENIIQINVTAEDGTTVKNYTIVLNKIENIDNGEQDENMIENEVLINEQDEEPEEKNIVILPLSVTAILALIAGLCYKRIKNNKK